MPARKAARADYDEEFGDRDPDEQPPGVAGPAEPVAHRAS